MNRYLYLLIPTAYLAALFTLGYLKAVHLVLVGSLCALYLIPKTRKAGEFILPIILTLLVYDGMKYIAHLISANAHVAEPYLLEKKLFGITSSGKVVTPNEFFQQNTSAALDLVCGIAYILYAFVFFAFAAYLQLSRRTDLAKPAVWSFFLVNMLGYMTYYFYAAAPPWYVSQYGLVAADLATLPSAAGALRFDRLLGVDLMANIYANGSIVFGAIPSLHVAYPFLAVLFAFRAGKYRASTTLFYLLVCFSAVYLNHHYIIDVILGTLYAVLAVELIFFAKNYRADMAPAGTCPKLKTGDPGMT